MERRVSAVSKWACGACGAEYPTQAAADECESVPMPTPSVDVGDIVTLRAGFGWHDGDRRWIANADHVDPNRKGKPGPFTRRICPDGDSNCFSSCCTFMFYYVVTHIDYVTGHRVRYHVATLAMTGKEGYHQGYTYDAGHCGPSRVANPPRSVVRSSKPLIGRRAGTLI